FRHGSLAHKEKARRRELVAEVGHRLKSECVAHEVGAEWSPTTLRCNLSAEQAGRLRESLSSKGLWCYIGQSLLACRSGEVTRAFSHVCPAFDWEVDEVEEALESF